jgi:hypothetical protein
MKQYKIYENQFGAKEAVKQGWSWPACCFTVIWAFVKKMNAIGGGVLASFFLLGLISGAIDSDGLYTVVGLLEVATVVVFGVNGNAWRERNLLSRGYELKGDVSAETDEGALALFYKQAWTPPPKS